MTSVKKPCINSSKHFYTGTELSPLHYGLSAEGYEINSVMEGFDKELWVVDIKNNKKVWVKNDVIIRITHEDPIINNLEPILNEQIVSIMNSNKANLESNKNEENPGVENNISLTANIDASKLLDKSKKSTDYNLFVKYRLNQLKDISKNKKENFNNVKNEWHEIKKDKENFKTIMSNAKIWYVESMNNN
jgi:hypothetical protein